MLSSPDSKVHGANMGPTWVLPAPYGPHVGPMNFTIWLHWPIMPLPCYILHISGFHWDSQWAITVGLSFGSTWKVLITSHITHISYIHQPGLLQLKPLQWRHMSIVVTQITGNLTNCQKLSLGQHQKYIKDLHYWPFVDSQYEGPPMWKALSCHDVSQVQNRLWVC